MATPAAGRGQPLLHTLALGAGAAKAGAMTIRPHILLLAGSFEARRVAEALTARGLSYAAWLSEPPRGDAVMPQTPELRCFDDAQAMQAAMVQGKFTAVLDASHGFDRTITQQATQAAKALGIAYLRLERPVWDVAQNANWLAAADVSLANLMIAAGERVFCATGWDSLVDFTPFSGAVLMLRQTRRHTRPAPYPFVELVFGDPPFNAADEQALFTQLKVDTLICRNLGGAASRPKLDAAAALGLKVILIERPVPPQGLDSVECIDQAMAWIDAL